MVEGGLREEGRSPNLKAEEGPREQGEISCQEPKESWEGS